MSILSRFLTPYWVLVADSRKALKGLITTALTLEGASFIIIALKPGLSVLLGCFLLHSLACSCFTVGMRQWLPVVYREQAPTDWSRLGLIGMALLFMPLLGMLGLLLAARPALKQPLRVDDTGFIDVAIQPLPPEPGIREHQLTQHQGALSTLLRSAKDSQQRVKAVLAVRRINSPAAMALLREALKDPVDDVRLLAYSILDKKENDIVTAIKHTHKQLERRSTYSQYLCRTLASKHWEMVWLGLAQGSMSRYHLDQASHYVEQVLTRHVDSNLLLLKGRIQLHQHSAAARYSFEQALAAGLPEANVLPYLMEQAYHQRDFSRLAQLAQRLIQHPYQHMRWAKATQHWGTAVHC